MGKLSNAALSAIGDLERLGYSMAGTAAKSALAAHEKSANAAAAASTAEYAGNISGKVAGKGKIDNPALKEFSAAEATELTNAYSDKAFTNLNEAVNASAAQKKSIQEQKERAARKNKTTVGGPDVKTPNTVQTQHAPTLKRINKKKGRVVAHKGGTANARE